MVIYPIPAAVTQAKVQLVNGNATYVLASQAANDSLVTLVSHNVAPAFSIRSHLRIRASRCSQRELRNRHLHLGRPSVKQFRCR